MTEDIKWAMGSSAISKQLSRSDSISSYTYLASSSIHSRAFYLIMFSWSSSFSTPLPSPNISPPPRLTNCANDLPKFTDCAKPRIKCYFGAVCSNWRWCMRTQARSTSREVSIWGRLGWSFVTTGQLCLASVNLATKKSNTCFRRDSSMWKPPILSSSSTESKLSTSIIEPIMELTDVISPRDFSAYAKISLSKSS